MAAPDDNIFTVAVADDHTLMRIGVSSFIARTGKYRVCMEAANGKELLEQLDRSGLPDIILLDISMPVMDGFKTMDLLKKKYQDLRVIALTMHNSYSDILKMATLGIKGYVLKTQLEEDILCALDVVAADGKYFPEEVNKKLQFASGNALYRTIAALKENELTFLKYLCKGMTYGEIAAKMHISRYTVKDYSKALFQKFDVNSKVALVLFAKEYAIVEV